MMSLTSYHKKHLELVEQCKQGDTRAQEKLYGLYSQAMLKIAMRITRDEEDAQDVLQESFIRAFRSLHSFKGEATFGAWLKQIVINTSINHIKKRRLNTVSIEEQTTVPATAETESSSDSPRPLIGFEKIREAIRQLPDGYGRVFSLYFLEGYDHKEIAQILDISEATSKSQFCRAKRRLRELLTEQQPTLALRYAC